MTQDGVHQELRRARALVADTGTSNAIHSGAATKHI
jgi:hypothetical protein